jgi:hypothetical protein
MFGERSVAVPFEAPAEHPVVPNGGHDIGIISSASSNTCFSESTAMLSHVTLNGPTSTRDDMGLLSASLAGLQSLVFSPGTPSRWSIVASDAELSPALNVSVGGIGMTSSGRGEAAAAKIIAGARAAAI